MLLLTGHCNNNTAIILLRRRRAFHGPARQQVALLWLLETSAAAQQLTRESHRPAALEEGLLDRRPVRSARASPERLHLQRQPPQRRRSERAELRATTTCAPLGHCCCPLRSFAPLALELADESKCNSREEACLPARKGSARVCAGVAAATTCAPSSAGHTNGLR